MTYGEIFNKYFPIYLGYGMSYSEFWDEEPELAIAYRENYINSLKRRNEEMWLQGWYIVKALECTVGNMFSKKGSKPLEYPKKPLPITEKDRKAQEEEEAREKFERMKNLMIARTKQQ